MMIACGAVSVSKLIPCRLRCHSVLYIFIIPTRDRLYKTTIMIRTEISMQFAFICRIIRYDARSVTNPFRVMLNNCSFKNR